ncbi:hypothetical protein [Skermania piniformis]|uniref:Uncharacterized protein n=1 Tax=Skermania pinensis TaxID=39122 RepID=A0ABX8S6A4_9ACTN|nr:hypothetical protein [Skermania piniformis]QXQ12542.1 hypothetical protein KV203_11215 [Skermania piniformis]
MPTSRPRHVITETDQVARALDAAARRWPDDRDRRARLLLRLVDAGHQALAGADDERRAARLAAISRTRGSLTGSYGAGYLDELRADRPE